MFGWMRLGLYTRISEDPTGTSDAPARQAEACRAWAGDRHEIVKVYEDRDISGYKSVHRPAFLELLADVQAGVIEGILCWRIERLLRNWQDWAKLDVLLDRGCVLLTEDGTDSRRDGLILGIKVGFAKEESRKISERVKQKNEVMARSGLPSLTGMRPFGYTRQREIIEEEAREIRKAAEILLNGGALRPIAEAWNAQDLRTSYGGLWTPSALRMMLKRPDLAGFRIHRGNIYPGTWAPILSESQHKALLALFQSRERARPLRRHYTSGLLWCGVCGNRLGANGERYRCRCGKVAILIRHVERAVEEKLREAERETPERERDHPDYSQERATLGERIAALDEAHFTEGLLDKFEHRRLRDILVGKLRAIQEPVKKPSLSGFDEWWPNTPLAARAVLARAHVRKVVVSPPGKGSRSFNPSVFSFPEL